MNQTFENIRKIAQSIAEQNELFLVDLVIRGSENNRVIEVFIDGEKNISAEECALVSRQITKLIDENELLTSYRLDVSSPGVDRPLIYLKQFPKHINRLFEIEFKTGNSTSSFKGKLISVEDGILSFAAGNEIKIKFEDIIKAKVLVSFN